MDAPAPPPEEESTAAQPPHALRGLFAALVEALRTRIDLAAVEIELHLRALLRLLIWAVGAVACAMLALAFAVTALVVALWSTHRMLALLGGSLVFVVLTALFGWLSVRALRREPELLEGSLDQLEEDQRRAGGVS
jgi:uncharacterized membrane protein YqjE